MSNNEQLGKKEKKREEHFMKAPLQNNVGPGFSHYLQIIMNLSRVARCAGIPMKSQRQAFCQDFTWCWSEDGICSDFIDLSSCFDL